MNTVSQSEVQAVAAAAAAAASAPAQVQAITVPEVAPYELHLIALSSCGRPIATCVRAAGLPYRA